MTDILVIVEEKARGQNLRQLIRQGLGLSLGFEAEATLTNAEAIAELERRPYDIIILSATMLADGDESLFDYLSEAESGTPIILLRETRKTVVSTRVRERCVAVLRGQFSRTDLARKVYAILNARPEPKPRSQTIIAFGIHQSDVVFGCGATLMQHRQKGDRVVVVTLPATSDRYTETIDNAIRQFSPDVVYTHSASSTHHEHNAVYEAAIAATEHVATVLCYENATSEPSTLR